MDRFPSSIIKSMRSSRAMTTCVPVQFDDRDWESAVFFELGGKPCRSDREILGASKQPFPIGLEADLINNESAAVVMLRFEVITRPESPLAGEVLIAPGLGNLQFETLDRLGKQETLGLYFSDSNYNVIHSQRIKLGNPERSAYRSLLNDAVAHDAMVRLTGKYDAKAALKSITSHYASHVEAGG